MKPVTYKRILAYLIDLIIIAIISNLLTINIQNNKKYQDAVNEYNNSLQAFGNKEITQEEFINKTNDQAYIMSKESVAITIVTEVITIISFVVVPYFMNGQTIGKKLMKLKIVSNSKKKITMNNYLIRGLLINSILVNVIGIVTILFLNKSLYLKVNDIITTIFFIFYMISISMIIFKEDKRGLHDIISGTKVVNANYKEELEEEIEESKEKKDPKLEDAEIIGEKKLKM